MKIFAIEFKISLLILIIVASIMATGYLSYKNLSQIVQTIHHEARPDYKLIKIKEINSDLLDADNSVRLYSLTREPKYLRPYNNIISTIDKRINELLVLQGNDTTQIGNIKAIENLISEKLVLWDQILRLHSKPVEKEVFNDFYTTIEKKTTDSITPKKNNILKRFFKKKKDITLGKEEVQQEVAKLERSLNTIAVKQAETESLMLKKNNQLGSQLQFLILQLEQSETESLFINSLEAEILARETYRWLAIFCVAAVILLIIVLFIIINYSRKSSQSQQVLRLAKAEAEKHMKAKELFTANVSHELRTPMNAIYGLSEQLLQQPMDSKLKVQLSVIKKSADYLNKIVNDILDFSKMQAGKLSIENIPFNPVQVFNEVCSLNQVIANQKHLNFECNFNENIPKYLSGDPTRLKQIVLNLLNNAFKFTDTGNVSISVISESKDQKSVVLNITVSDTGIGISPEKLNLIFDDYTQAEQSINRQYGGTGLGLSIVKRLLDMMGGTISVTSKEHEGTSFTCQIPFEIAQVAEVHDEEFHILSVPEQIKNLRVLIADDEEFNRMLLATIFKKWNISFQSVSNGKEAIEMMQNKYFDIVLMDLRMPEINGYDAARTILNNSPDIKIIALTAGNHYDDINKCKEIGMMGYLLKPFSEKELYNTLINAIGDTGTNQITFKEFGSENEIDNDQINVDDLYKVSGGDDRFVDDMLSLFQKTTNEGVLKLNEFYKEKNWTAISDIAHKMAPPCRHLGAHKLYQNLKTLEKLGMEPENSVEIVQLIEKIQFQVKNISARIEEKLQNA